MLTNLEVTNGIMTPKYDIYNDNYTVFIDDETKALELDYVLSEKVLVDINNNFNLDKEEKIVSISLKNDDINRTINLYVYHEDASNVSDLKDYFVSLETNRKEITPDYIAPLIGGLCFLIMWE